MRETARDIAAGVYAVPGEVAGKAIESKDGFCQMILLRFKKANPGRDEITTPWVINLVEEHEEEFLAFLKAADGIDDPNPTAPDSQDSAADTATKK